MLEVVLNSMLRLLARLFPWVLRRAYSEEKLANKIKIAVRSDGEGVSVWDGEHPRAIAWIELTNLTPFDIEVDRGRFRLAMGQQMTDLLLLEPRKIKHADEEVWHLEAFLCSDQLLSLRKNGLPNEAKIEVYVHLCTSFRKVDIRNRYLSTKNFEVLNLQSAE